MYRTARECYCVSNSEGVLSVSVSEGVLLSPLSVRNQRTRKCCCVPDSEGVLCVSGSEGVLLCTGQRGSDVVYREATEY